MALDLFKQITTELSKLDNDIINANIRSYEQSQKKMTTQELYDAAQELIWTTQEIEDEQITYDDEQYDVPSDFKNDIIDICENLLEEIYELL